MHAGGKQQKHPRTEKDAFWKMKILPSMMPPGPNHQKKRLRSELDLLKRQTGATEQRFGFFDFVFGL
jgi:hypothetical protein